MVLPISYQVVELVKKNLIMCGKVVSPKLSHGCNYHYHIILWLKTINKYFIYLNDFILHISIYYNILTSEFFKDVL